MMDLEALTPLIGYAVPTDKGVSLQLLLSDDSSHDYWANELNHMYQTQLSREVNNMKSLKVLVCAACLLGTVSGAGFAKDVQTIAGSMVVPNNVNVVSASKTNTRVIL